MADHSPDIYAASRKDLRDTLKWYFATLSGLLAALAGGISFGIIPDLRGDFLVSGVMLGVILIGLVVYEISKVQALLSVTPFDSRLMDREPLAAALQPYLAELLPGDVSDWRALNRMLDKEEKEEAKNLAEIQRLEDLATKVTSFAAFMDLERKVRETNKELLEMFCIGCGILAALTWLHGEAKATKIDSDAVTIHFSPGASWSAYAAGLSSACSRSGAPTYPATGKPDTPIKDWWMITLDGPVCKGVTLAVPGGVVAPR